MPRTTKRSSSSGNGPDRQPGATIKINADGSASGVIEWEMDAGNILAQCPRLYSPHPDEPVLFLQGLDITYREMGKARVVGSYFGLTAQYDESAGKDKNTLDLEVVGQEVNIRLHPKFAELAGTAASPKDGAIWVDPRTGEATKNSENAEFRGWSSGDLAGVETYIVPRVKVRINYKSNESPNLPKVGKVYSTVKGYKVPAGVKSWLCMGAGAREIGGVYQCSAEFWGDPHGWNKKIYGDPA